ncbi:MAG TPA: sugar kinase [Candidatus Pullichristensenella excrementigallinarum]|uniref:Sugar kinase n=1 Tax=Candidatus Pullichristensenella excrementigallinarum TaxID=2840907 RepID=A0A9D1ICA5_9FIRM|nr:sugar kinase [Candidatus Pullichristensenella excrementigallinarum]
MKQYKYDVLAFGFAFVEVPRKQFDVPFTQFGDFVGPFPSADTAIMIDTAQRLGARTCYITAFGDDKFGEVVRRRLEEDGVDLAYTKVLRDYHPAVIFVRYNSDGSREYLSTGGGRRLTPDLVDVEAVRSAKWVHFSGEVVNACQSGEEKEALMKVFHALTPDQKVSLDPNDGFDLEGFVEMMAPFVERADLILPSEGEAKTLIGAQSDQQACKIWASQGKIVALKRGAAGCDLYYGDQVRHVDAFKIEQVDPTGCGDSFCAGLVTGLSEGMSIERAAILANAAGALQATRMGPMEGSMPREVVERFIRENGR